jgi:hypothetical protein
MPVYTPPALNAVDFALSVYTPPVYNTVDFELLDTPIVYYGILKRWDGASWVKEPLKVWNGVTWATKPLKVWDGASWQLVDITGI